MLQARFSSPIFLAVGDGSTSWFETTATAAALLLLMFLSLWTDGTSLLESLCSSIAASSFRTAEVAEHHQEERSRIAGRHRCLGRGEHFR